MLNRAGILERLRAHKSELERLGVRQLRLFGSFARDDATELSDVDLVVSYDEGASVGLAFLGLQERLRELLDRQVDLLRAPVRKPDLAMQIDNEGVDAFE